MNLFNYFLATPPHNSQKNKNNKSQSLYIYIVRTNFDLNPEQEWNQAQKAQTINL